MLIKKCDCCGYEAALNSPSYVPRTGETEQYCNMCLESGLAVLMHREDATVTGAELGYVVNMILSAIKDGKGE